MMPDRTAGNGTGARGALSRKTLSALYDHAVKRHSSSVAMKCRYPWGYRSISYEELGRLWSYLGAGLIRRGLQTGDRVALLAANSPEWAIVYGGVTACGGVIVPLDVQLKENEIRHLLIHSEATFLVVSLGVYQDQMEGKHLGDTQIVIIGEGDSREETVTLSEIMAAGKEALSGGSTDFARRCSAVNPDDVAAICYTSGTTGQPKGAVLLHRNIVTNVEATGLRLPYNERDVFLSLLPLHHTLATTCNLLAPLHIGSTIVFGRSLKPRDIKEDITTERVSVIVGVPLLFEHFESYMSTKIAEVPRLKRFLFRVVSRLTAGLKRLLGKDTESPARKRLAAMGLGSIRFCVSGGAALRRDTGRAFQAIGIPILEGYGMTEASPVISVNPLGRVKPGTVGPALPGVEIAIDDPNAEGVGEITVRGPNVMREYFKNPEATRSVLGDGRLRTGDLGSIDADGYLTIRGRKKSVIVTAGGKNVYPDELESLLGESPFVLESIVLPFEDKRGNERIGAIIVPDYDAVGASERLRRDMSEQRIREIIAAEIKRVSEKLPDWKRIVDFQIRDEELPKTATRKLKRHLVKWIKE